MGEDPVTDAPERVVWWSGPVDGPQTTFDFTTETDGYLTVTVIGEDDSWTYVVVVLDPSGIYGYHLPFPWPILTWAYAYNQDFISSVTTTIPLPAGSQHTLDWGSRARNTKHLAIEVSWTAAA